MILVISAPWCSSAHHGLDLSLAPSQFSILPFVPRALIVLPRITCLQSLNPYVVPRYPDASGRLNLTRHSILDLPCPSLRLLILSAAQTIDNSRLGAALEAIAS